MMQWLATKSPKKEAPESPKKNDSGVPQWSSQFLQKSPLPTKRATTSSLLDRWLKQEKEEEVMAKRPHSLSDTVAKPPSGLKDSMNFLKHFGILLKFSGKERIDIRSL
ncbi:hypothetical protein A6R68_18605 [Neotoma lepida]|uniref:Uncharacterized protein n=1 Tax=Neotoma lepida TaxID=56216 RepID=A0A1A6HM07_NEOLE|nr:hypothetical protein A6R68_18605 [Neotoma lepida]